MIHVEVRTPELARFILLLLGRLHQLAISQFLWNHRWAHQLIRMSEVARRGSAKFRCTLPFSRLIHAGELRSCSCPASCSCWYCVAEGDCGEPICFHAVYA